MLCQEISIPESLSLIKVLTIIKEPLRLVSMAKGKV